MRTTALILALLGTASLSLGQAPCCILASACCARPAATQEARCCSHCAEKQKGEQPAPKKCECKAKHAHLANSAEKHQVPEFAALPHFLLSATALPVVLRAGAPVREVPPTGPPRPLSLPLLL